ncbi:MAG: hypothetical protein EOO43_01655 [Flavobacterium sp.]|nr:MAG: hypothetical protein EOO43_01655 [Flavobacterium sp.]
MMPTHSLEDLKHFHNEATNFFGAELMMLKEVIPMIKNDRIAKAAVLLMSCGQTGAAFLQLANQTDSFTRESAMLARAFMETITNFCYVGICDDKEYRSFILHPIYKQYHNIGSYKMENDLDFSATDNIEEIANKYKKEKLEKDAKQAKMRESKIVQEALAMFSDTKPTLNWSKKSLNERLDVLRDWGKFMDFFFAINKMQYYSDASEALHGSLYGCTYNLGMLEPGFNLDKKDELEIKLYKDSTCMLLHLGMLIHESFTLILYTDNIKEIWEHSYKNRGHALSLLFHVIKPKTEPNSDIK